MQVCTSLQTDKPPQHRTTRFTYRHTKLRHCRPACTDLFLLVARNSADEQTAVVDGQARADVAARAYLQVVQFARRPLGVSTRRVGGEAVAAIGAVEVEHQTQLVQIAEPLQDRHQLVLETPATATATAPRLYIG